MVISKPKKIKKKKIFISVKPGSLAIYASLCYANACMMHCQIMHWPRCLSRA